MSIWVRPSHHLFPDKTFKVKTEEKKKEGELIEIYCTSIRKNGKTIYPKNRKYFHFWVKDKR